MISLFAGLLLGLTCQQDDFAYCTDTVIHHTLSYENPDEALRLNVALGDVMTIELPEDTKLSAEPVVGNKALIRFQSLDSKPKRLLVWPMVPDGAKHLPPDALLGQRTNLIAHLQSGITLTIDLKLGFPGESVQRLVLAFPERKQERAFVNERVTAELQKLKKVIEKERQDLEVQAELLATKRIARGMLEGFDCHQQSFRAADRLLSVRVFEICRLGDEILLRTQIKNRARALFTPESLTVFIDGKALPTAVFPEGGEFHQIKLPFDARLNVIASARGELVKQAQSFSLELAEIGGKNRTVRLDGVSF